MSTSADTARILEAIEGLRRDVARLEARVVALEAMPGNHQDVLDGFDQETVMAIAGALAAFFGKKPRIRSIRLLGSDVWAQQGRTTTQAGYSVSPIPTTK